MNTITGESLWGKVRIQNHDPYTPTLLASMSTNENSLVEV
ncbi:hypothetical protein [Acetomicrobium sp. S15 = DSM 107314]